MRCYDSVADPFNTTLPFADPISPTSDLVVTPFAAVAKEAWAVADRGGMPSMLGGGWRSGKGMLDGGVGSGPRGTGTVRGWSGAVDESGGDSVEPPLACVPLTSVVDLIISLNLRVHISKNMRTSARDLRRAFTRTLSLRPILHHSVT